MSITVVGSIAFDAVKTPFGARERMLGGAATHFALAASFFDTVHVVGPVGEDFAGEDLDVLATRGTDVADVERVGGGRTFFWRGEYGWDLNSRETLATELGVFEQFEPKLSVASRACDVLFLANIQPQLQLSVLEQCDGPRLVAMDSMNLWIDIARDPLIEVIRRVDCVILNDAELRQLTNRPNLMGAAREVLDLGPTIVVAKHGEYGASLITREQFFALPAYPLETVVDPTGAGDTFAGGFVGHVARVLGELGAGASNGSSGDAASGWSIDEPGTAHVLRQAMAYGTALASYNVEEFGTERVYRLAADEIRARVDDLQRMTQFEHDPIPLG